MDTLAKLNQQLRTAAFLLDGAATQIRDVPLSPAKQHIRSIGEALVSIYEVQSAIYKLRPGLEVKYEEPPHGEAEANRRLGKVLIEAGDLADSARLSKAVALIADFAANEPSEYHRELATAEIERMMKHGRKNT